MTISLSWQEIKTKYPDSWVSLSDLEFDDDNNLTRAKVLIADKELKTVTKKTREKKYETHSFRFTGRIKNFLGFSKWELSNDTINK